VAADAGGVKKEDFIAVFKDRNFWVFVIFIVGTWSFYNIFDQQLFPVFYAGLFESHDVGTRLYGYLNSFQGLTNSAQERIRNAIITTPIS
ncbi:MFS transporter, partial [Escherichia sp. HC-CC]